MGLDDSAIQRPTAKSTAQQQQQQQQQLKEVARQTRALGEHDKRHGLKICPQEANARGVTNLITFFESNCQHDAAAQNLFDEASEPDVVNVEVPIPEDELAAGNSSMSKVLAERWGADITPGTPRTIVPRTAEDDGGLSIWQRGWQFVKAEEFVPGTREEALAEIHHWASSHDKDAKQESALVRVLHASESAGKTVLLAHLTRESEAVLASYFFLADARNRDLRGAFMAIAHQICEQTGAQAFAEALQVHPHSPLDLEQMSSHEVFEVFVAAPAREAAAEIASTSRSLLVLDGIDQCTEEDQRELARTLHMSAHSCGGLRFLVSARSGSFFFEAADGRSEGGSGMVSLQHLVSDDADAKLVLRSKLRAFVDAEDLDSVVTKVLSRVEPSLANLAVCVPLVTSLLRDGASKRAWNRIPQKGKELIKDRVTKLRNLCAKSVRVWACIFAAQEPLPLTMLQEASGLDENEMSSFLDNAASLVLVDHQDLVYVARQKIQSCLVAARNKSRVTVSEGHDYLAGWIVKNHESAPYAFSHASFYLARVKCYQEELKGMLSNFFWLLKVTLQEPAAGCLVQLVRDGEHLIDAGILDDEESRDVLGALSRSLGILCKDPLQLAGQLAGRLPMTHMLRKFALCFSECPWICPLGPTLEASPAPEAAIDDSEAASGLGRSAAGSTADSDADSDAADSTSTGSRASNVGSRASRRRSGRRAESARRARTLSGLQGGWGKIVAMNHSMVASGGHDNDIVVRDRETGEQLFVLQGHKMPIMRMVMPPETDTLISASQDKTVRLWDLTTGASSGILTGPRGYVRDVVANSRLAVSCGGEPEARVWSYAQGTAQAHGTLLPYRNYRFAHSARPEAWGIAGRASSVAITEDLIAVGYQHGAVCIFDCDQLRQVDCLGSFSRNEQDLHEIVALSFYGSYLATGRKDGRVEIWELSISLDFPFSEEEQTKRQRDEKPLASFRGCQGPITGVQLVPDDPDTLLVAGKNGSLSRWDWKQALHISSEDLRIGGIFSMAFDQDALILGGNDFVSIVKPRGATDPPEAVSDAPLRRSSRRSSAYRVAEATRISALRGLQEDWGGAVALTDDFVITAGIGTDVHVRDRYDGEMVLALSGHEATVSHLAAHGSLLASSSFRDGTLRIWNLDEGQEILKISTSRTAKLSMLALNSSHVASARGDEIRVWSLESGEEIMHLRVRKEPSSWVRALAMDENVIAAGYASGHVRVFSCVDGAEVLRLHEHHVHGVGAIALLDGVIATGGEYDRLIKVYDMETQTSRGVFSNHSDGISALAMDADVIVAGSDDYTVSTWNRSTRQMIARRNVGVGRVESIAFSGGLLVAAGPSGAVFVAMLDDFENTNESRISRRWDRVHVMTEPVAMPAPDSTIEVRTGRSRAGSDRPGYLGRLGRFLGWSSIFNLRLGRSRGRSNPELVSSSSFAGLVDGDNLESDLVAESPDLADLRFEGEGFEADADTPSLEHGQGVEKKPAVELLSGVQADWGNVVVMTKEYVVAAGTGADIHVRERLTGETYCVLRGHEAAVSHLAARGSLLASSSFRDGTLRIWNLDEGQEILKISTSRTAKLSMLALNSSHVAAARGDKIRVWSLESGEEIMHLRVRKEPSSWVRALAMDENVIAAGYASGHVRVFSCVDGAEVLRLHEHHVHGVGAIALLDGVIATGGELDGLIKVYDMEAETETNNMMVFSSHSDRVSALSMDADVIVAGSDDYTVSTWDRSEGKMIARRNPGVSCVESVALSGGLFAAAGANGAVFVATLDDFESSGNRRISRRWERVQVMQGSELEDVSSTKSDRHSLARGIQSAIPPRSTVRDASTSFLGSIALGTDFVAVAHGNSIVFYDRECPNSHRTFDCGMEVSVVTISEDGIDAGLGCNLFLGSIDGSVLCLSIDIWSPEPEVTMNAFPPGHVGPVRCIHETGDFIVTGSDDGTARVWSKRLLAEICSFRGHNAPICAIGVNHAKKTVVSGSTDGAVMEWTMSTGVLDKAFENCGGAPLAIAAGQKRIMARISTGRDSAAAACVTWDRFTGRQVRGARDEAVSAGWLMRTTPPMDDFTCYLDSTAASVGLTFDTPLSPAHAFVAREKDLIVVQDALRRTHLLHVANQS